MAPTGSGYDRSLRTFGACVELWKTDPETFRLEYACPVLLDVASGRAPTGDFMTHVDTRRPGPHPAGHDPPAPNPAQLVAPISRRPGAVFEGFIGIGRARNADIRLPYQSISKLHAYFSDQDGTWFVADAGSTNGTFVNRRRLGAKEKAQLTDRTVIGLGTHPLVFYSAETFRLLVLRF